jgi:hypothetical protein
MSDLLQFMAFLLGQKSKLLLVPSKKQHYDCHNQKQYYQENQCIPKKKPQFCGCQKQYTDYG